MKVSVAITVLNEQRSITALLESLIRQTKKPDDIIIVDGGSKDKTVEEIKEFKRKNDLTSIIRLVREDGTNRPRGRNIGIKLAKYDTVAITDAGCTLDKNWLKEIITPLANTKVDIVSGYYKTQTASVFEQCVAVYTLVMPDKINPSQFLPSARSMAIRKKVWEQAGGFPENFPLNEDYVFAKKLKKQKARFSFTKKAIVYWQPRENLIKAFFMFYYFAKGDASAHIFRPKVTLIFVRYLIGFSLLILFFITNSYLIFNALLIILITYVFWAIIKNYKYIKHYQALFFLPLLQFTSDIAVLSGAIKGLIHEKY